jgi:hypothetical protein
MWERRHKKEKVPGVAIPTLFLRELEKIVGF